MSPVSRQIWRALTLSCAVPALLSAPALAQQTAAPFSRTPPETATSLEEITVSATGVPTPTKETGSSVTVLTADQLDKQQIRTVPDALRQVPGLNIVQSGGPGAQTSVFIRGSNSNHVKVQIDGIDVNDPSTPNRSFQFESLLTDDLARIEVLRGPQSGLYGGDAIGGVISFVTKRGEGPAKASLTVEGGSYGTFNQNARISGASGIFDYSFSVAHFLAAATPITPFDRLPVGVPLRTSFFDNKVFSTKMGWQLTDEFRINYVARFNDASFLNQTYAGFPVVATPTRDLSEQQTFATRGEAEWMPFAGFRNIFGANYSRFDRAFEGPYDLFVPPTTSARYLGERTRFDYRGDYVVTPGTLLLFGAQREDERFQTTGLDRANGNTAGFGEIQSAITDRLFVVGNVRYDANDQFGDATTYRVAPSYIVPYTETRLKGSVGTGFKPPTLSQLYQDFPPFFFANPNLQPETSIGYDAGIEQPIGPNLLVGATYYQNDFKNLIDSNATFTSYANVGRATSYGAESFIAVKFTDAFSARVDYTNTVTKNEITNQELLRRPRHKVSATAFYTPYPGLTFTGTVIGLGDFVDIDASTFERLKQPGFVLVNLSVNYLYSEGVTLFARVDNLFDRRYENPNGFLGPGLAVYGGVRLTTF